MKLARILLIMLCFAAAISGSAKKKIPAYPDSIMIAGEMVYGRVDAPATYPGGDKKLNSDLNQLIRYPRVAQENGIQGSVTLRFVVKADGSIGEATVVKGVHPSLDDESLRVLRLIDTPFQPATLNGQPVNGFYTHTLKYILL